MTVAGLQRYGNWRLVARGCTTLVTPKCVRKTDILIYSQTIISILSNQIICIIIIFNILYDALAQTGMSYYNLWSDSSFEKIFKSASVDHQLAGNSFSTMVVQCAYYVCNT